MTGSRATVNINNHDISAILSEGTTYINVQESITALGYTSLQIDGSTVFHVKEKYVSSADIKNVNIFITIFGIKSGSPPRIEIAGQVSKNNSNLEDLPNRVLLRNYLPFGGFIKEDYFRKIICSFTTNSLLPHLTLAPIYDRIDYEFSGLTIDEKRLLIDKSEYETRQEADRHMVRAEFPIWTYDDNTETKLPTIWHVNVNKLVANDVKNIMSQIYNDSEKFPIFHNGLYYEVEGYEHRLVRGGSSLSEHSFGVAIDINSSFNPLTSKPRIISENPTLNQRLYAIHETSNVVRIFKAHGWYWGGEWSSKKDYMHFSLTNG
jgi:hypothetical protein